MGPSLILMMSSGIVPATRIIATTWWRDIYPPSTLFPKYSSLWSRNLHSQGDVNDQRHATSLFLSLSFSISPPLLLKPHIFLIRRLSTSSEAVEKNSRRIVCGGPPFFSSVPFSTTTCAIQVFHGYHPEVLLNKQLSCVRLRH